MDERVRATISLMEADFRRKLSLDEMARAVNLSPSRLRHLFKAETSLTPAQYLRRVRIWRADSLLAGTFLRVKEVGHAIGMGNSSYFVRIYKKTRGLTPTEYRRCRPMAEGPTRGEQADSQIVH
jgi:transcriptional regulator GlxA family with amidase domain